MKLGIFTTISDPKRWQYAFTESMDCYTDMADIVVVVDGSLIEEIDYSRWSNVKVIKYPWPYDWHWKELPLHIQRGYDEIHDLCDVAIKMDADYLFHEKDRDLLKIVATQFLRSDSDVASFNKFTLVHRTGGFVKAKINTMVRARDHDRIAFGIATDQETDWCFPVIKDGNQEKGVYTGLNPTKIFATGITVLNYDYFFKTQQCAASQFNRFAMAYLAGYGKATFGDTYYDTTNVMNERFRGMLNRDLIEYEHPKYMKERIENMKESERGYNCWGLV